MAMHEEPQQALLLAATRRQPPPSLPEHPNITPTIVSNVGAGCVLWHALFQRADEVDRWLEGTVGAVDRSCNAATASGLKAYTSQGRHWSNA
jgi:hypothetical protein